MQNFGEAGFEEVAGALRVLGAVEQVGVEAEGGARGGVPELAGDEDDVGALSDQQ
jgi:hypothetical protein